MIRSAKSRSHLHTVMAALGLAVLLLFGTPAEAQQISQDNQTLVRNWLAMNCGLGDAVGLDERVKTAGPALVPAFADAFEKGPDEELRKIADKSAAERFQRRQQVLKSDLGDVLPEAALKEARAQNEESFVARQRANLVNRYKSQALAGLSIVGGDEAQEILAKIAADESSPYASTAQTLLERMNE